MRCSIRYPEATPNETDESNAYGSNADDEDEDVSVSGSAWLLTSFDPKRVPWQAGRPNFGGLVLGCIDADLHN